MKREDSWPKSCWEVRKHKFESKGAGRRQELWTYSRCGFSCQVLESAGDSNLFFISLLIWSCSTVVFTPPRLWWFHSLKNPNKKKRSLLVFVMGKAKIIALDSCLDGDVFSGYYSIWSQLLPSVSHTSLPLCDTCSSTGCRRHLLSDEETRLSLKTHLKKDWRPRI